MPLLPPVLFSPAGARVNHEICNVMKLFRFAKHNDFGVECYSDFLKIGSFIFASIDVDFCDYPSFPEVSLVVCWPHKTHAIRLAFHLGKLSFYVSLFGFQVGHRDYWYSPESYSKNYDDLNALLND